MSKLKEPVNLRFDIIGAYYAKENRHAQVVMKELGITYQHATPQSMGDQWLFWNCQNLPETLPKYLDEFRTDPMKMIGYGLNEENAIKIRDFKI